MVVVTAIVARPSPVPVIATTVGVTPGVRSPRSPGPVQQRLLGLVAPSVSFWSSSQPSDFSCLLTITSSSGSTSSVSGS